MLHNISIISKLYSQQGAIQVLHNAVGVGVSAFPEKMRYKGVRLNVISITRSGWGSNFQEKSVT